MKLLTTKFLALLAGFLYSTAFAGSFTAGNLAIVQADASATNTTASVIELNKTTAAQTPSNTIAIVGTGTNAMRFSGSATSTLYAGRSADGSLLTFMGANSTNTSSNVNTLNPRAVVAVNAAGRYSLATTYTGTSGQQTRSATSLDNTNWYIADQAGLYTNGATAASPSGNFRAIRSFGGVVYAGQASGTAGVIQIVTLSAITGGTATGLPGLANNSAHQDFYLIQSGDNGSTFDVLYVMSATSNTVGTIAKFSLVSGTWTANGTHATAFGGFGIAAEDNGTGAILYVTSGQGALAANNVIKLTDTAGYNAAIAISTPSNVTLYTAPAGKINKGIAFAPVAAATITGAGTALAFTTAYGTASAAQTFAISGSSLTADITATAPTGFEVSSDGTTFGSSATFTQSGGTASGTVHLRLKADAAVTGSYNSLNVALTSTGATTVNITTAASGNAVTAAALTITGVSGVNKPYDGGTTASLSGTPAYVGLQNSESFTVTGTAVANFDTAAVGNSKTITVTGYTAPTTNYTVSQPTGLTGNVTAVALTITANDVIKPQGQTLTGGTGYTNFTTGGLVNSETVGSVTVAYGPGGAAGAAAGSYTDEVTISDATGGTFTPSNYDPISYVPGDITVSASPTINTTGGLVAVDTTYGSPSATPTSFSASGAFLTSDITVTAPANYEVSTSIGSGYGASVLLTQSGGTVAATTIYVRLAATAPVTGSPHGGNVVLSSTGATPVNVVTVPSAVAAKNLTISGLSGEDKEYDRSNTASFTGTPELVGIIGSDDVSLAGTPASTFADLLVGVAKPITVTGYTLAGTAAPNYTLTQPTGLTADITAKALTITGAAVTAKPFDGTTTATITGTLVGIISPDVVTLVGTGNFDTAGPGTGIAVTSTSSLAGANAGNYSLTQPVGLTGDITANTNANLSSLVLSTGAYSRVFDPAVLTYVQVVPNATSTLTVTPTTANGGATVTVGGNPVTSGNSSGGISLNEGINTITTVVTAQDATTTKTYTITVVRQSSAVLAVGSIAFTGFNADGNDNLAFAALTAIPQNTVIFFTDEEWNGTNWASYTECCYLWVATSNVAAGTIVTLDDLSNVFAGTASSNLGTLIGVGDANNNAGMGASDESIFAFQGTGALAGTVATDPVVNGNLMPVPATFLAMIASEDAAGAGYSIAGTGLSEAAGTAIIFVNDDDGMRYKGARSGQVAFADFLPLIADKTTNWDTILGGDGTTYLPFNTTAFITGSPGEVSIAGAAVTEGNSGTVTLSLPVTRTNTATAFTVQYAVTGGTATSGTDYVALASGTLTFTNGGSASQNIDITVNGDTDVEGNETVTVTLSNVVNTTGLTVLTTASASGTINTDDNIPVTYPPTNALTGTVKGFITLTGAEISAFDPASKRAFATSNGGIQVVDLTNPATPTLITNIAPASLGVVGLTSNDVSSVALRKAVGATPAVLAATVLPASKLDNGHVIFLNPATGALLGSVVVGQNPDHVCFSPDGTKVLVANEGELNGGSADVAADTTVGSVSIIDISGGLVTPTVSTAGFAAFDTQVAALRAAGVRIFKNSGGTDAVPSTEFEPEYIAISPGGTTAMVTLQEANAVAVLNIATATFTSIVPMGQKNYSAIRTDLSDRDNGGTANLINPVVGNPVFGLYMPDTIGSYSVAGQTYYVTANEGDDRNDFLTPDETTTVANASYDLDNTVFPNELDLKTNAKLGRLTVSNSTGLRGDTDGDGDIDQILSYGARSFSILDAAGNIVFDSGDMIEMIVASQHASNFDDSRSDNKGPEPEGITVATIGARTYAFVALERSGMVLAFDVTNPAAVTHTTAFKRTGDQNPEGLLVVSATDSPTGKPLLLSSNETSATLTIFEIDQAVDYKLQLLHLADAEAGLLASSTAPNLAALVDGFDGAYPNTLILAGGDNFIPGPFIAGGTDISVRDELNTVTGSTMSLLSSFNHPTAAVDIAIHNLIGVEASTVGNHEFDLGTRVFRDSILSGSGWVGATFPYLSANLDFSGDSDISSRFANTLTGNSTSLIPEASTLNGRIAPAVVITKGGEKIGLVGVTTQILESISSTGGVEVKGFVGDGGETNDMALLASQIQPAIDELKSEGVDKIILMAHLQQITFEQQLAPLLNGVDIILAAGSNTRLGDSNDVPALFTGHTADFAANYPIYTAGSDGLPTVIVNTDNEFTYLGRLVADFDSDGVLIVPNLTANILENGAYAATDANVAAAWNTTVGNLATTAFAANTKGTKVKLLTDAVQAVISAKDGTIRGYTGVYLEGERNIIRNQQTNLGDITADSLISAARTALPSATHIVGFKNGGGIRSSIGAVDVVSGAKTPPIANPSASKPAGAVSQLDIENSLRFNNSLMVCDTTPAGLKAILEHGVFLLGTQGRFPQVGGIRFSYNPSATAGSRVQSIALVDENDNITGRVVSGGAVRSDAPALITLVTMNFLAQGGDSYPFKANADNFRYLRSGGLVSTVVDESLDFGGAANVPADILGEQAALSSYLQSRYATPATAFDIADTAPALDTRIQSTAAVLTDTVLSGPATFAAWLATNGYTSAGMVGDTDNNGTPDILEYFFNQNPNDGGDVGNLPRLSRNGSDLELQFTVNSTSVYSGVLRVTDNLVNWRDAVQGTDYEVISVITAGGETTYRYRVLASGSVPKFFQLELVDAP
jgi:2',3'-cyclic-nucleotide 2'-phosphodiesterase (5'-nucleotidase family)